MLSCISYPRSFLHLLHCSFFILRFSCKTNHLSHKLVATGIMLCTLGFIFFGQNLTVTRAAVRKVCLPATLNESNDTFLRKIFKICSVHQPALVFVYLFVSMVVLLCEHVLVCRPAWMKDCHILTHIDQSILHYTHCPVSIKNLLQVRNV